MTNIFVGNLSFHTTEQTLRALFEQFGSVDRVSLVTDRETGKARGFGFVEMAQKAEAENAIAALTAANSMDAPSTSMKPVRRKIAAAAAAATAAGVAAAAAAGRATAGSPNRFVKNRAAAVIGCGFVA